MHRRVQSLSFALAGMALLATPCGASAAESENLLRGAHGEAGYCTADPAAATTVPGWILLSGSAAIRCTATAAPAITGGPFGSARLQQTIDLAAAATSIDAGGVTMRLTGALTGRPTPALTATCRSQAGAALTPPARLPGRFAVPPGTRHIDLALSFGPGTSGRAQALSLTLSTQLAPAKLVPPPSAVPAFDHVFLIMMENTDYAQIIGDTKNAPFTNSLRAKGTLLRNYNANYHPSDENYLAIAAGDTLVRGAVYFPHLHLRQRNIADNIEAAHKSWRAYEQGMGTPCNTTTTYDKHYEPDDAPFVNFTDIFNDKSRCRAHVVDTSQLATDLASAATTPAFAWMAADGFDDGEDSGNGAPPSLRAQDSWLKTTLTPLFASPAWRTQRSLLILTWDESNTLRNNHIAGFVLGSQGLVRAGAVSDTDYDHYSTARTIEAALGLPPLTPNDHYAQPLNDAFLPSP
jgi:hypothetical protein